MRFGPPGRDRQRFRLRGGRVGGKKGLWTETETAFFITRFYAFLEGNFLHLTENGGSGGVGGLHFWFKEKEAETIGM